MPHINSFCQTLLALLLTLCALAPAYAATDIEDNEYVVFYHHDVLGSPKAATDEKGRIIWREHGTPYGRTLGRTGSGGEPFNDTSSESGDNRPGYTGHTLDTGSGLIYMKGRYYDPSIGRFLSNDPVGTDPSQPASFNRYAYANNNPYVFVDPDGRNAVTAFGGLISESIEGAFGVGDGRANYGNLGGALADGYNGQGAGFGASLADDALTFGGGAVLGSLSKISKLFKAGKKAPDVGPAKDKGLGQNPFQGKSRQEIADMLEKKGYEPKGKDPLSGKGNYVNPNTGRGYHIDTDHAPPKGPHVGVSRPRDKREKLKTRDYRTDTDNNSNSSDQFK